jgi:uncharacterized membrane protein YidH (DUF202 family)
MNLSEPSAQRNLLGWMRAAVLTMLVFGIVGTHGLAAHCSPSGSHSTEMAVVAASPLLADQAERTGMGEPVTGGAGHRGQSPPDEGTDGHHLGMVGICIVALAGLALALSIALVRRNRTLWRIPRRVWLRTPRPRSRLPRPPTLAELSLLRC